MDYKVKAIGKIENSEQGAIIRLEREYIPALKSLSGFSHINVIWWFSGCDNQSARSVLQVEQPYKGAPEIMGVFATRSPERPNPIALTSCEVIDIDYESGVIVVPFIDADDNTPVLDIKPYTPSLDRVEKPEVPEWCGNWPKSTEESGDFDWEQVFNF